MGIRARLETWRRLSTIEPIEEDPAVVGGRRGELRIEELVGTLFRSRNACLLAGRRIPSVRHGRRREVDLLVCTPQMIHVIEVKNWAGQLKAVDGVWRQINRSGRIIEHVSPIQENLDKRSIVVEYLRACDVQLDEAFVRDHICQKVILMNWRLQVDPEIEANSDVITRHRLDEQLQHQPGPNAPDRLASSLIDWCLESEPAEDALPVVSRRLSQEQFEQIVACLAKTGTWDRLHLYGTKTVVGDVLELVVGSRSYRREMLAELAGGNPIRLAWTRNRVTGLLKAITGIGSLGTIRMGQSALSVSSRDAVKFHEAGEEEPDMRALLDVKEIVLG